MMLCDEENKAGTFCRAGLPPILRARRQHQISRSLFFSLTGVYFYLIGILRMDDSSFHRLTSVKIKCLHFRIRKELKRLH